MDKAIITIDENLSVVAFDCDESFKNTFVINLGDHFHSIFKEGRELSKLTRWMLSSDKVSKKASLNLFTNELKFNVTGSRIGDKIYFVLVKDDNQPDSIEDVFWDVFTKTYPGGIIFLDSDNVVREVSLNLMKLLNVKNKDNISLSKKNIIDRHISFLFNQSNDNFHENFNYHLIQSIEKEHSLTFDNMLDEKHLRVFFGPIFQAGEYIGNCIYVNDVSDEMKRKKIIESQKEKLFNSSKLSALGEMAGGIAHEINNPLTIIRTKVDLILKLRDKKMLTDEILIDDLNSINETIERIAKIIKGMRVVSRDSTDEDVSKVKIGNILSDVLGVCNERYFSKGIKLKIDVSDNVKDLEISCRAVQISQVLINLLNNAYDVVYKTDEPWIELSIFSHNKDVIFKVRDSNKGIDKKIIDKIFQPFFTTKDVGKGTGLGLSLSAKIISEHGGELKLDQDDPHTSFVFNIPFGE